MSKVFGQRHQQSQPGFAVLNWQLSVKHHIPQNQDSKLVDLEGKIGFLFALLTQESRVSGRKTNCAEFPYQLTTEIRKFVSWNSAVGLKSFRRITDDSGEATAGGQRLKDARLNEETDQRNLNHFDRRRPTLKLW